MARPTRDNIQNGVQGWDSTINDNLIKILDQPYPIPLHSGDETDLASTYAAASFDKCIIWVDHTVAGWVLYRSNGTSWAPEAQSFVVACSDEETTISADTSVITFRMPYAFNLIEVRASLTTASTSGAVTIDINETASSILSTKLTIDQDEKTSTTAATAHVLSDVALADDAEITIDIDGAGTGAAGLKVTLIGVRA
jgi:hypothetical protein